LPPRVKDSLKRELLTFLTEAAILTIIYHEDDMVEYFFRYEAL